MLLKPSQVLSWLLLQASLLLKQWHSLEHRNPLIVSHAPYTNVLLCLNKLSLVLLKVPLHCHQTMSLNPWKQSSKSSLSSSLQETCRQLLQAGSQPVDSFFYSSINLSTTSAKTEENSTLTTKSWHQSQGKSVTSTASSMSKSGSWQESRSNKINNAQHALIFNTIQWWKWDTCSTTTYTLHLTPHLTSHTLTITTFS